MICLFYENGCFFSKTHSSSFCFTFFLIESELFSSSAIGEISLFSASFTFTPPSTTSAGFYSWISTTGFGSSSDSIRISTGCSFFSSTLGNGWEFVSVGSLRGLIASGFFLTSIISNSGLFSSSSKTITSSSSAAGVPFCSSFSSEIFSCSVSSFRTSCCSF